MQAIIFEGVTNIAKAPPDWDEEKYGPCADLPVQIADGYCRSIWKPSPEQLAILNAGGGFVLDIVGNKQPVVAVNVCELNFVETVEEVLVNHEEVNDNNTNHGAVAVEAGDIIGEVEEPADPDAPSGPTH